MIKQHLYSGFQLRLARKDDAEAYFLQNFNPLDKEIARLTGCREVFTHDEVVKRRFATGCCPGWRRLWRRYFNGDA